MRAKQIKTGDVFFRPFKKLLRRHPTLTFSTFLVYATFVFTFLFRDNLFTDPKKEVAETQRRITELEQQINRQDLVIDVLSKRSQTASFLKNLEFQEDWKNNNNRTEVLRLLEYANYAIEKNDFTRAAKLYEDASAIQNTLSVPYYSGRLSYVKGDLSDAILKWKQVVQLDSQNRYPEPRLYIAIALYELGRSDESDQFLRQYLTIRGHSGGATGSLD